MMMLQLDLRTESAHAHCSCSMQEYETKNGINSNFFLSQFHISWIISFFPIFFLTARWYNPNVRGPSSTTLAIQIPIPFISRLAFMELPKVLLLFVPYYWWIHLNLFELCGISNDFNKSYKENRFRIFFLLKLVNPNLRTKTYSI